MALFLACIATKHTKIKYFYINIFLKKMIYFLKNIMAETNKALQFWLEKENTL